jgi:phage terminase small subunit
VSIPDDERPEAPAHLSAESRALWTRLVAEYEFTHPELKTLRLALGALDRAEQARKALRRHGLTYTDRFNQPHARPEVQVERDSRAQWLRLMGALALPTEDEPEPQPRTRRGRYAAARNKTAQRG